MDYDAFIGICSFLCGVAVMFAIHRVVFDIYSDKARNTIRKLRNENRALKAQGTKIEVEHVHTYATPADVADLQFLED